MEKSKSLIRNKKKEFIWPLLSEADPATSTEGTIDPLGLFAIADSLAMRLAPGIRERQSHPRFLTAIAVSCAVCADFDEDVTAKDGISPPWQVFEWYMVEGLVRTLKGTDELRGLPGNEKASDSIKADMPLSARTYLKTPSVFGFHGVYRVLSKELDIVRDGRLGETGYTLLKVWSEEQDLNGFIGTAPGAGKNYREMLKSAVVDGLENGAVARSGSWQGWDLFRDHLAQYRFGKDEAKVIRGALQSGEEQFRTQFIGFIASNEGEKICQSIMEGKASERDLHRALMEKATPELRELLQTVQIYETFSRLLLDAFNDCLWEMSKTNGKTSPNQLSKTRGVQKAYTKIPKIFPEAADQLSLFGETVRFQELFNEISIKTDAVSWVSGLMDHHRRIQMKKPPNGKNPWFERFDDGSAIIRRAYRRETGGRYDITYVNPYRIRSIWSFVNDLGLVHD
jgi:hypothetical protein